MDDLPDFSTLEQYLVGLILAFPQALPFDGEIIGHIALDLSPDQPHLGEVLLCESWADCIIIIDEA